jgi:antitoxin HicB
MIAYPAIFRKHKRGYWVEFPDVPGCLTEGKTLDHAKKMAREALTGVLEVRLEYDEPIRRPDFKRRGPNVHWIEPEIAVAIAVTLRAIRKRKGQTMRAVAERMNVSIGEYQRLEDPRRSNPTLRKLQQVCQALEIDVKDLFRRKAA